MRFSTFDQGDPCIAIGCLIASGATLTALRNGLKIQHPTGLHKSVHSRIAQNLNDPLIKKLFNGIFLEHLLTTILKPRTLGMRT